MTGPNPMPMRPPAPREVRIGLWGAPASGKTTYLASLNIATNRWRGPGHWIMNGVDDVSSEFLTNSTDLLTRQQLFPPASKDNRNLLFRFTGTDGNATGAVAPSKRWKWGKQTPPAPPQRLAFELDLLDVPGSMYGTGKPDNDGYRGGGAVVEWSDRPARADDLAPDGVGVVDAEQDLLDHLEICSGIIYLFDPVRDAETGDAFQYFHRMLEQLARRCFEQERYPEAYLPQHLAVCVTKFDEPEVYRAARRYGLTTQDEYPPGLPCVPDEYAREFFDRLCYGSGRTSADLVNRALVNHFHPNRIKVFVTSAIGFHIGDNGRFRPNDFANVLRNNDGNPRIRGAVHPINVLEPVIWLHQSVRHSGRRPW